MRRLLLLALLAAGCARPAPIPKAPPEDCRTLYVILPGNFIVDLAAGAHVALNPSVDEFVLFCSPASAAKALHAAALPGDWRVYRMKGNFEEIAEMAENGQPRLAVSAEADDWLR